MHGTISFVEIWFILFIAENGVMKSKIVLLVNNKMLLSGTLTFTPLTFAAEGRDYGRRDLSAGWSGSTRIFFPLSTAHDLSACLRRQAQAERLPECRGKPASLNV
jgi:hypothetical protein